MADAIETHLASLNAHRVTVRAGALQHGNQRYLDWAIIRGRPHRHEFGDFIRRWVANRVASNALLVTAPSDRPVRSFLELPDRQPWTTRTELARAIFEWIEGWYNPRRRHTSIGNLSPVDYERRPVPTTNAA